MAYDPESLYRYFMDIACALGRASPGPDTTLLAAPQRFVDGKTWLWSFDRIEICVSVYHPVGKGNTPMHSFKVCLAFWIDRHTSAEFHILVGSRQNGKIRFYCRANSTQEREARRQLELLDGAMNALRATLPPHEFYEGRYECWTLDEVRARRLLWVFVSQTRLYRLSQLPRGRRARRKVR